VNQARAFPQPSLDYDSDLQPSLFNFKGSGESYFGISQSIEFPGKRTLRGKIAKRESSEILQDIDLLKLDIAFQVKEAFYGLLLAQEKLNYAKQDLELAQDFLTKAELKFSAGDVAKVEVLRARVEASKAANEVRSATNDVRLAKALLNFLLARKKYEPLEIIGELKKSPVGLDLDVLIQKAHSFRPEIRRIDFSLQRENLQKKTAYMDYRPDFDLGVSRHRIEGEGTWWDVTLSLPIPLFFWQPRKGEIAEAEANIQSLQREAEHIKNLITLEVEEAYMNAQATNNQIRLFEDEIITQAEEVYNMFLFSYQEGEIGSIELIDARRTLVEARKSYADALYNYSIALAALEKSIGQSFQGEEQ
jgi:outer membrane protein TolC